MHKALSKISTPPKKTDRKWISSENCVSPLFLNLVMINFEV
jgi:hypothetical protein